MKISNKTYDTLKWSALIGLPAVATFLMVVLPIAGVGANTVKAIAEIIAATETFIGTCLGISTAQYTAEGKDADRN